MICCTRPVPTVNRTDAIAIARIAVLSLDLELQTWPKPGLVSLVDSGSHHDMDAALFRRSAATLEPFFAELALAGGLGAAMQDLRRIGQAAEAAMLTATRGINTHKGVIFGLGLLCAAAGARSSGLAPFDRRLGAVVRHRWGAAIRAGARAAGTHGALVYRRYGAGGARSEAEGGFPNLYRVGLPTLRHAAGLAGDDEALGRVQACFALIATVEDTNLLFRGGGAGLAYAQREAIGFLKRGGVAQADWREQATVIHSGFVARRLSPGASADLLAMTIFVDLLGRGRNEA